MGSSVQGTTGHDGAVSNASTLHSYTRFEFERTDPESASFFMQQYHTGGTTVGGNVSHVDIPGKVATGEGCIDLTRGVVVCRNTYRGGAGRAHQEHGGPREGGGTTW